MSVLYAPEVSRAAIIGQQERQARLARMTPPARYNQTAADEVAWERQICGRATPIKITAKEIIRVVCDYYHVSQLDIISARRTLNVMIPRQIVMYLARELTPMSTPQIGARQRRQNVRAIPHIEGHAFGYVFGARHLALVGVCVNRISMSDLNDEYARAG